MVHFAQVQKAESHVERKERWQQSLEQQAVTETATKSKLDDLGDSIRHETGERGVKFRGVSEIGTGGVIRLRQTYLEPHVGWTI